jgi:hypothetical protein
MIVWPDGEVTGSVDVAELEEIRKAQKGMSKKKLEAIGPVESLAQLLAGPTPDDEPEAKPEATEESSPKAPATKEK